MEGQATFSVGEHGVGEHGKEMDRNASFFKLRLLSLNFSVGTLPGQNFRVRGTSKKVAGSVLRARSSLKSPESQYGSCSRTLV